MAITAPVLVLNASYEPISIASVRRALKLCIKQAAIMEEVHDHFVWRDMRQPSVIRLIKYRKVPKPRHQVSRRSIFARDQHTCQYCLDPVSATKATLDHVIPKSRGGADSWENLVTCCRRCNLLKADRLPEEVGMKLAKKPLPVSIHSSRFLLRTMGAQNALWQKYLYY